MLGAITAATAGSGATRLAREVGQVLGGSGGWHAGAGVEVPAGVTPDALWPAVDLVARGSGLAVSALSEVAADGRTPDDVVALARAEAAGRPAPQDADEVLARLYRCGVSDVLVLACSAAVADGAALRRLLAGALRRCGAPVAPPLRPADAYPVTARPGPPAGTDTTLTWSPAGRPTGWTSRRRVRTVPLDEVVGHRLAELAARESVTPGDVLAAGLRVLLARHTGRPDLLLGLRGAVADAPLEPFGDLLVVSNDLRHDDPFRAVVRREAAAARAAARLPDLVAARCPDWVPGTFPLVQAVVDDRLTAGGGAHGAVIHADDGELPFDLVLTVGGSPRRPVLTWSWHPEVPADRLPDRFAVLLAAAVADAGLPAGDLPLLTTADRRLVDAVGTARPAAATGTVLDLVDEWVARTPDAVAVRAGEETRTYRQLDTVADRIAGALAAAGLPGESRVGVLVERGADLPAMLLGVWRSGAACVPLDAAHPVERLRFILRDAEVRVLLTDRDPGPLVDDLPIRVVRVRDALTGSSAAPLPARPAPGRLASVLYTSGSTGRPKGVAVPHRGLANCVAATRDLMGCRPGERLLALTTVTFDIAMLELFLMPAAGGETVVGSGRERRDGEALRAALARWRPQYVQATPATWQMLLYCGWEGDPELTVSCGGDVVSPKLAARLRAMTKGFWHTYGPTEASMYAVCTPLPPGPLPEPLPIGLPLPGVLVRILDERLRPVPPGVVGELCIGGDAVAREYLNRPELTAERFLSDPQLPGGRLYRTGDLAVLRADGRLELCGRNDRQVKIRGHRIEPAEIEQVLGGHPDVASAAVRVDGAGDARQIVAFLQLAGVPDRRTLDAVAEYAKRQLPHHMLPARYAVLDRIPVTVNGKLDRAALAALRAPAPPAAARPRSGTAAVADRVWRRVLGDRAVPDADFLACGGTAADAVAIVAALNRELGVRLPVAALYEAPTVEAYATLLRRARLAARPGAAEAIDWLRRDGRRAPLILAAAPHRRLLDAVEPDRPVGSVAGPLTADAGTVRRCSAAVAAAPGGGRPVLVAGAAGAALVLGVAAELSEETGLTVPVVLVGPPAEVPPEAHRPGGPIVCIHDASTAADARRWRAAGRRAELLAVPAVRTLLATDDAARLAGVVAALS